jgi:uncharacterized membrane protein required for colicin V production
MTLDVLALVVLAAFVALGAWRGALASTLGVVTLVVAYAASIAAMSPLGRTLAATLGLPPLLAAPVAGTLVFALVLALLGGVARSLVARQRRARGVAPRSTLDSFGGGLVGGLRGAFVVLLLGWLGAWTEALREAAPDSGHVTLPSVEGSRVTRLAEEAVEVGAGAVVGRGTPQSRVAVQLLAHPAVTLSALRGALASPALATLRDDAEFWDALERGDVAGALARGSFRSLPYDPTLREDFARLGLVPAAAAGSPQEFALATVDVVRAIAPRIAGLRSDPELQGLLADPEVQAALKRGDRWALLGHPGFQKLAARLAAQSS